MSEARGAGRVERVDGLPRQSARFAARVVSIARWRLALAVLQTVLLGLSAGAGLILLIPLLTLTGVDAGFEDLGLARRVQAAFETIGVVPTLPLVLGIFLAVSVLQAQLARWQAAIAFDLHRDVMGTLRRDLYFAIVGSRWAYFARHRSTDLSHALTTLAHTAGAGVHHLIAFGSGLTVGLVHLSLALYLSPLATAAALGGGAVLGLLLVRDTRAARTIAEEHLSAGAALHGASVEHLQSFKTMKGVGAEARSAALFSALDGRLAAAQRRSVANDSRQRWTFEVGAAMVLAAMVLISLQVVHLSTGTLLLLLFTFARLMPRLFGAQQNLVQVAHALPAFVEVERLTACFRDQLDAPASQLSGAVPIRQAISLRRISFAYGDRPVVQDLSLEIPAGSITALVGASGAGKTTVLDLLMGLLTPSAGEIVVDGQPLVEADGWRRQVGYVAQETFVFHDTLRANLLWARPEASEDDLRSALTRAAAWEFVSGLEHGLDTVLGDRGCRLSGGERQRLALARALLGRPALLILDEATNALDRPNEDRLLDALEALKGQVTIVMVAHRLSCVSRAELVHVLEDGRIVESGRPDDLLAHSTRFRALQGMWAGTADPVRA